MSASRAAAASPLGCVRYRTAQSSLGGVLLACGVRGACAVLLADRRDSLPGTLQREFPGARLQDDQTLTGLLGRLVRAIEMSGALPTPALDLRGTAFQKEVWRVLRAIPPGQTWSYAKVAARLGRGRAWARAVGGACAANRLALLIPCHRVVAANGRLGGWRWHSARKKELLAREAQVREARG